MMNYLSGAKTPRDFVHVDEFWEADDQWSDYYFKQCVWVFVDEYRAELAGDEDYARIIIHAGNNRGWIFRRPLSERSFVFSMISRIVIPVSEQQLEQLGFITWQDDYL